MQGKRTNRVGHLIQMELGQLILTKLKDPRLGFITVTHVDVAPDLKTAIVFYSVLGSDKQKTDSKIALERATGFLQKEIATALKLRYTPRLNFRLDDSLEQTFEIERALRKIEKEKESGPQEESR